MPSSSEVRSRSAYMRQEWQSLERSNRPILMLVLPTSIAMIMVGGLLSVVIQLEEGGQDRRAHQGGHNGFGAPRDQPGAANDAQYGGGIQTGKNVKEQHQPQINSVLTKEPTTAAGSTALTERAPLLAARYTRLAASGTSARGTMLMTTAKSGDFATSAPASADCGTMETPKADSTLVRPKHRPKMSPTPGPA